MTVLTGSILFAAVLFLWALFCRWLLDNPRGDAPLGFAYHGVRLYSRWFHHIRIHGESNIPPRGGGPLIVVCNHTAGLDPIIVQAACTFEIRWMMATDMMLPRYRWLWDWTQVIGVDRESKRDTASARRAIRHLESGGVLGVFPEGGIERPPHVLRPFMAGVGLIIAKTGAPVLPAFIDGTPITPRAWGSLWIPSRPDVTFGPLMRFARNRKPEAIAREIQSWFETTSGWPVAADAVISSPVGPSPMPAS